MIQPKTELQREYARALNTIAYMADERDNLREVLAWLLERNGVSGDSEAVARIKDALKINQPTS